MAQLRSGDPARHTTEATAAATELHSRMAGVGDAADGGIAAGDPARPTHPLQPVVAEVSSDRSKRRRRETPSPRRSSVTQAAVQDSTSRSARVHHVTADTPQQSTTGCHDITQNNPDAMPWERAVQVTTISPLPEHSRRDSPELKNLMSYNPPGLKDSPPLRAVRVRTPSRAVFEHAATAATTSSGKRRWQDPHR